MSAGPSHASFDAQAEIAEHIETLLAAERRLVELTAGEVDSVTGRDGRTFLLQRAQEQLRHSDAARQTAILNALPAHIALVDIRGNIVSVNEAWERFGRWGGAASERQTEDVNYLAICDATEGPDRADALAASVGIGAVLAGTLNDFSFEYPCHSPTAQRWFLMMVTPLRTAYVHGAVIMHVDITERKRAEEATRESDERFAGAFEQAPIGVALVAPNGRWLRVNRALCELVGYSAAELMNRTFQDITYPADLAQDLELVRRILAGEIASYQLEKRYIHARGHVISVFVNVSLVHDSAGRPSYFITQVQDITARREAEIEVRFNEQRYRSLVEATSAIVWDTPASGEFEVPQPSWSVFTGQSFAELRGWGWLQAVHPDDQAETSRVWSDAVARRAIYEVEHRLRARDQSYHDMQVRAVPILGEDGSIRQWIGVHTDITGRKRASEALRASEKRFRALFDQAAVGVAQTDADTGRYLQANRRFCEIVGRDPAEIGQLTFAALTHPQDLAHSLAMTQRLRAGTIREYTEEKRYVQAGRDDVWANVTVSAMWTEGDKPDFFIVVAQDITQRKRLEAQLRQAQKMEAIGTLAGGIAHDFNNVLAAINGYTELARLKLADNPEGHEILGSVLQAAGRATHLVRQILTFSRQEQPERRPILLEPIVAEAVRLLRASIPSMIEFDLSLAPDAPVVLADETQIHQILMNLGTNAWHAMKDRPGRLKVTLATQWIDEAYAATQPGLRPGSYARISVSDTGCGMDPVTLQRIFEPFFTTKPVGEGTGLGLAVVHGIMASHEGVVTVYSQPGEGTVFHLYFPAHGGEVAALVAADTLTPSGNGESILFVDDEELLTQLGRKALVS